ncbi:MAG TPA: holo-ACP synthase [Gemmatimonadales bacterium]
MAVIGIGIDVVDLVRAQRLLLRHGSRVLERFLLPGEREYVTAKDDPARHFAVRVAAKEAVYKAFQTIPGAEAISWQDIEVERTVGGRPHVRLHGRAAELAGNLGRWRLHLSLTHTDQTAAASAVLEADSSIAD